ncbi:MAG TPA: phosphate ABC transporter permease subunit PstC [Candidatus Sulfotelmatobacter sp.]|nr:phosphate ABC transporter permease subunit PstC [Candidatus Sulfotelmatobacter sp.]
MTTASRSLEGLRARPSLRARLDLPRRVVFLAAASMVAIVAVLLGFILWRGLQLFLADGVSPSVLLNPTWTPENDPASFGLLPFILGTIGVTAIGLVISTPLAVGLAIFLSEVAPPWARRLVQPALEVFVGIPSVVWGLMGLTVLVPFLRQQFGWIGFTVGFSWLAGSLVLSMMVLPTITTITYDALRAIPLEQRTASLALGTTRWQTIRHILLPSALAGILTALVLGMARAAGEALAVQMVIGNRPTLPTALTQPVTTLTSQIALDMGDSVPGSALNDALWTMAAVLLLISMGSVVLIRLLNTRGRVR